MGTVISAILALAKAVPIFDKWLERLWYAYAMHKREGIKAEYREGVRAILYDKNQIPLEQALGSPTAGKPTGLGDVVSSIAGMPRKDSKP